MNENKSFNSTVVGGIVALIFGILAVIFSIVNGGTFESNLTLENGKVITVKGDIERGILETIKDCKNLNKIGDTCKIKVEIEIEVIKEATLNEIDIIGEKEFFEMEDKE